MLLCTELFTVFFVLDHLEGPHASVTVVLSRFHFSAFEPTGANYEMMCKQFEILYILSFLQHMLCYILP